MWRACMLGEVEGVHVEDDQLLYFIIIITTIS